MKREFWITEAYPSEESLHIYKQAPFVIIGGMHVREVAPIDWKKIWDKYSHYERTGLFDRKIEYRDWREVIQELVEREIKGE